MFNENSAIVKVWLKWYDDGRVPEIAVPKLYNLRDVIRDLLVARWILLINNNQATINDVTTDFGVKAEVEKLLGGE